MQNRRIGAKDHRGMGELLNEVNEIGKGARAPATYYVEVSSHRASQQRLVQQKVYDPLQVFFANELKVSESPAHIDTLSQDLEAAGISGTTKLVLLPLSKNKILVRIENIADPTLDQQVDLDLLSNALKNSANPKSDLLKSSFSVAITEMSLTGNMPLKEMRDRKIIWNTAERSSADKAN